MKKKKQFLLLVMGFLLICPVLPAQEFKKIDPDKDAEDASRKAKNHFDDGVESYKTGAYEDAIQHFTYALDKSPSYFPAQANRGLTYLVLKDEEKAEQDLSAVVNEHSESHAALFGMGILAMKNGDYESSRHYLDKAVTIESDNAEYYYALGKADDIIAQYEFAINDFQKAIELDPRAKYYVKRGNTYAKIDQLDKAKEDYEKALEIENNLDAAKNNLMVINSSFGDDEGAEERLTEKVEAEPENASNYMSRGVFYLNNDEKRKALQDFNKAVELDENNLYTHILRR